TRGTRGLWNGPRHRRRRYTTSRPYPSCTVAGPCGTSSIRMTRTGNTSEGNEPVTEFAPSVGPLTPGHLLPSPPPVVPERNLTPGQWGMPSFLVSEAAFFSTLIVVYRVYLGVEQSGPTPAILSLPLVIGTTICLLASSVTVHLAVKSLACGDRTT